MLFLENLLLTGRIKIHVTDEELNMGQFYFSFSSKDKSRAFAFSTLRTWKRVPWEKLEFRFLYSSREARTRPFRIEGSTHVNRPRYLHNTTVIPFSQSLNVARCVLTFVITSRYMIQWEIKISPRPRRNSSDFTNDSLLLKLCVSSIKIYTSLSLTN